MSSGENMPERQHTLFAPLLARNSQGPGEPAFAPTSIRTRDADDSHSAAPCSGAERKDGVWMLSNLSLAVSQVGR